MTNVQGALQRIEQAFTSFESSGDKEADVTDMLVDLRHYCDRHNLDFADLNRTAYGYYLNELNDERREQSK